MQINFNNQNIVITGGTGGIGFACAKAFAESGGNVVILDVNENRITEVCHNLGGTACGYKIDISNTKEIPKVVSDIVENHGVINVLIQTAGILKNSCGLDIDEKQWDTILSVNAKGTFFMMQEIVKQSMSKTGGTIVNIASLAGIRGMNKIMAGADYSASKGAVVALTMQEAVEWAEYNIRVNAIAPGGVKTKGIANFPKPQFAFDPIPLNKLSEPEDIAYLAVFLASDKAKMITGQTIIVDGGSSIVGY